MCEIRFFSFSPLRPRPPPPEQRVDRAVGEARDGAVFAVALMAPATQGSDNDNDANNNNVQQQQQQQQQQVENHHQEGGGGITNGFHR